MTKRIKVAIEHETRKALLISADGRKGWIQRRWLAEDGTISVKTFEKAASNMKEDEAAKADRRTWQNAYHAVRIDKETERGAATEVSFHSGDDEQTIRRMVWFPKSLMRDGKLPGWKIEQAVDEMTDSVRADCPVACAFLDPEDADRLFA